MLRSALLGSVILFPLAALGADVTAKPDAELAAKMRELCRPGGQLFPCDKYFAAPATAQPQQKACCVRCSKGIPCGNSCIAANKTCHQPPGCAC